MHNIRDKQAINRYTFAACICGWVKRSWTTIVLTYVAGPDLLLILQTLENSGTLDSKDTLEATGCDWFKRWVEVQHNTCIFKL